MLTLSIQPNSPALSGNPLVFKVLTENAAGTPWNPSTVPAQHSIEIDISIEETYGSTALTLLGTVTSRISDASYNFVFDISATLHAWYQDYFKSQTAPIGSGNTFDPSVMRRYQLTIREKNTTTTIDTLTSDLKAVLFGIDALDAVFPPADATSAWLSAFPLKRFVNLEKPILVSWYNNTGAEFTFSPKFTLYGRDGLLLTTVSATGISIPLPFSEVVVAEEQVVTFSLGALNFGTTYPLSNIGRMIFEPNANGATTYAAPITFFNDLYEHENERILMYRNRKGVIEILRCTGEFTKEREVARYESVTVGDYTNQAHYYGHRRQYDADVTTIYTFRTGYINKVEKAALADMFIINDIWWVTNGKYIPLRLLDNKFEEFDTFEELSSVVMRCALKNVEK
jgi:hypothetical protein